jgi:uroporphyrinogen-III decarboxylase
LIQDPSGYFSSVYLPRVFGALEPWSMLPFLPGILEIYGVAGNFIPYGLPPVQAAFNTLYEAGAEALKWAMAVGGVEGELASMGYPQALATGFSKAPFDTLSDTLRGTKGIMLDIYRQPDKLLEAMDVLTPLMIKLGIGATKVNARPIVFMPLHKGADDFISDEQFKKFYWPTLRKVIMGLIEEGCVPFPALEGHWGTRLEVLQDIPKGKTVWMVDQSDMEEVKKTIGKKACLVGNVSSSMLSLGKPQDVKDYVKKLIDTVGKDGGLIISNGAFFDHAKAENVKAMVEAAKEYGKY